MKLRLTESQYNRLLTENNDYGRLSNTFTEYIIRIFQILDKKYSNHEVYRKPEEVKKTIKELLELDDSEVDIIYYNYDKKWIKGDRNINNLKGQPLEWVGTYLVRTVTPSIVRARSYLMGFIEVQASSPKEALQKASVGSYIKMYLDEDSVEYRDPDLDYDLDSDSEIMEDMTLDHLNMDIEDDEFDMGRNIILKK